MDLIFEAGNQIPFHSIVFNSMKCDSPNQYSNQAWKPFSKPPCLGLVIAHLADSTDISQMPVFVALHLNPTQHCHPFSSHQGESCPQGCDASSTGSCLPF